jgi:hypothetical protein
VATDSQGFDHDAAREGCCRRRSRDVDRVDQLRSALLLANAECAAVIPDDAISPNAMRVLRTDLEQSRRVTMDDVRNRGLADGVPVSLCYRIRAQL